MLSVYQKKRNFRSTPEPKGANKKLKRLKKTDPVFVVQQHAATNMHYDFRLEMEGVLKSWAIPKGPSMNPEDKRLAVMVEDHPLEYKDFEGTIPEGSYGAGEVIVWDAGTYHSAETDDPAENEKILSKGLKTGHLSIILSGKKLMGEFGLIRIKGMDSNQWLLIKKHDEFAKAGDILKKNKSVLSGRPIKKKTKRKT